MSKRIKKQFWLSPEDAAELKRKAQLCGLTETAAMRILIRGFIPCEKPDQRFYDAMAEVSDFINDLNRLLNKANATGSLDSTMLHEEVKKWSRFLVETEKTFLVPQRSGLKWS